MQLVGGACVIFEIAGADGGIRFCDAERFAHIPAFDCRKFIDVAADKFGEFIHQATAFLGRQAAPFSVDGGLRCGDGGINLGAPAPGNSGDLGAVRWVNHRDALPACNPGSVNEMLVFGQHIQLFPWF